MKLLRFIAKGVHGYFGTDIEFLDDLTFLTGINGCGKTTTLNAIVSLITPDLMALANLSYDFLELRLQNNGKKISIFSEQRDNVVALHVSSENEIFVFPKFKDDPDLSPGRRYEHERDHYRELITTSGTHPVLKAIDELPIPMFLGLDRRSRLQTEEQYRSRFRLPRWRSVNPRNVFGGSIVSSLHDAAALAEDVCRDALISTGQLGEELQREMLLNLLTFSRESFGSLSVPTRAEVKELGRIRRDLGELPQIFRLEKADVEQRAGSFLEDLQTTADEIPLNTDIGDVIESQNLEGPVMKAIIKWSANKSQLKRIKVISEIVSIYNERKNEKLEPIERYIGLVNGFLNDSGKSIGYDERGYISVKIEGVEEPQEITSLSSGEAQIFVILTHLSFNPLAQEANVFIIDEPELSLHVRWQELFVDSVQSANPNIQYVLATHSPSIILDRTDRCIELSPFGSSRSRA